MGVKVKNLNLSSEITDIIQSFPVMISICYNVLLVKLILDSIMDRKNYEVINASF